MIIQFRTSTQYISLTESYIYIYIYMFVCVCVCVCVTRQLDLYKIRGLDSL